MEKLIAWFKKNYRSLALCFMLSLGLWFVVALDKEYTHTLQIPLKITRLAPGLVLKNKPPENAKIRVSGTGSALLWFSFFHSDTELQLPEVESSATIEMADYVDRLQFGSDKGIVVRDIIEPTRLNLQVDRLVSLQLPLRVDADISPEAGFLLVESSAELDSATVTGPQSMIDTMAYVETQKISRKDVRYPFDVNADLKNPYPEVITIEPQQIAASFVIEQIVERTVYNIPIRIINVPQGLNARPTPETISLRVKGAESRVAALDRDEISVIFDFATSYSRGESEYLMQIDTPDNITWLEASPEKFSLKLIRKENQT